MKEHAANVIVREISRRGLTQSDASREIESHGIKAAASQISLVCSGKLDGFSVERLFAMANGLGVDIKVSVKLAPRGAVGRLSFVSK